MHNTLSKTLHFMSKTKRPFMPLNVAILTVSDTRTRANDTSGDLIEERLSVAGHKIAKLHTLAFLSRRVSSRAC